MNTQIEYGCQRSSDTQVRLIIVYLMYVDESGDSGNNTQRTRYFVLSGLVIHETAWKSALNQIVSFRRRQKVNYGLKLREEIHAFDLISQTPTSLRRIPRYHRLAIVRHFIDEIETLPVSIINVVIDKQGKAATFDVFETAWTFLIQRFENTVTHHNFPGPNAATDFAIVLPDDTNRKKLTRLLRRMRHFNIVPNIQAVFGSGSRNLQLNYVIEDPHYKDSLHSYFCQAADCVAYMLHQELRPNRYIRQKTGRGYFHRLNAALCVHASRTDPRGIVRY